MAIPPKHRRANHEMAIVLLAGLAVAVLGFLTGTVGFGLSLALCFLIWIVGALIVNRRKFAADKRSRDR